MIVQKENEPLEVEFIFLSENVRTDENLIESKKTLNDDLKQIPNIVESEQKNEEIKLEEGRDNANKFFFDPNINLEKNLKHDQHENNKVIEEIEKFVQFENITKNRKKTNYLNSFSEKVLQKEPDESSVNTDNISELFKDKENSSMHGKENYADSYINEEKKYNLVENSTKKNKNLNREINKHQTKDSTTIENFINKKKKDLDHLSDKKNKFAAYSKELKAKIKSFKKYPRLALRKRWQGKVEIKVLFKKNGDITKYEVKKSSKIKILDKEALLMVQKGFFLPENMEMLENDFIIIPIEFSLKE